MTLVIESPILADVYHVLYALADAEGYVAVSQPQIAECTGLDVGLVRAALAVLTAEDCVRRRPDLRDLRRHGAPMVYSIAPPVRPALYAVPEAESDDAS